MGGSKGRHSDRLDFGHSLGRLRRWSRRWLLGLCKSNVSPPSPPPPSFPNFISSVKLLSGSLSHENPGNQFGHAAPIFTILLLVVTAVLQIICLNRGLKVYDSTLVVPVFYGVYTATGWLDSLIFNGQVEAYKSWTLFLIFVSILVLISGVVLLTHKKPEPVAAKVKSARQPRRPKSTGPQNGEGEDRVLWAVGDDEDDNEGEDDDIDHHQHPLHQTLPKGNVAGNSSSHTSLGEQSRLIDDPEDEPLRRSMDPFKDDLELNNLTTTS
jgi:predicted membrane channel-forming protein YqfA (hemolysin III family)